MEVRALFVSNVSSIASVLRSRRCMEHSYLDDDYVDAAAALQAHYIDSGDEDE